MNDAEPLFVDSVYIKTVGPECCDYNFVVGNNYYPRYDISLGKISKLCIQGRSDIVVVVAKVISGEKEILVSSIFFRNNIVCIETTAPYTGEFESYEDEEE